MSLLQQQGKPVIKRVHTVNKTIIYSVDVLNCRSSTLERPYWKFSDLAVHVEPVSKVPKGDWPSRIQVYLTSKYVEGSFVLTILMSFIVLHTVFVHEPLNVLKKVNDVIFNRLFLFANNSLKKLRQNLMSNDIYWISHISNAMGNLSNSIDTSNW